MRDTYIRSLGHTTWDDLIGLDPSQSVPVECAVRECLKSVYVCHVPSTLPPAGQQQSQHSDQS